MGKARFSMAFDEAAGGFGPVVVARGRSGPVVRRRAVYRRKSTQDQLVQEGRLRAVAAAWAGLGAVEARAWAAYGATIQKRDPVSGTAYSPTGYNAFSGLALRIVQIDPAATIPPFPPAGRFLGDGVIVTVASGSPSPSGSSSRGGRGKRRPEPPSPAPSSITNQMEEGVLTFNASGANASGVVTELMVQRLANVRRTPTAQYKCAGFVAFSAGHLGASVVVAPGVYACAYRFVQRATGRATMVTPLGVVTVA